MATAHPSSSHQVPLILSPGHTLQLHPCFPVRGDQTHLYCKTCLESLVHNPTVQIWFGFFVCELELSSGGKRSLQSGAPAVWGIVQAAA